MDIVKAGQSAATIVIPDKPLPVVTAAAEEFQYHVRKATGAKLDVVTESAAPEPGEKIFLGATQTAAKAGLTTKSSTPNAFQIKLIGQSLFIVGDDSDGPVFGVQLNNRTRVGTLFGVYEFLQKQMGVRWLWPGELGEVVPAIGDVVVEKWDQSGQPPFVHARWRDDGIYVGGVEGWASPEAQTKYFHDQGVWLRRHRFALGVNMDMGHAFTKYWDRFSKEHPEYFNLLPDRSRRSDATYFKGDKTLISMSVGEPAFWGQIIADWLAQRSPQRPHIVVSENDTEGRCVCDKCLALDEPDPDSKVPFERRLAVAQEQFAKGDSQWTSALGSLSDRYARYYLAVQKEAEKHEPDAVVMGYAYGNYRKPPRNTRLNDRVIIGIVPNLMYPWTQAKQDEVRTQWEGWAATGAKMFLRPNYMIDGHDLPVFWARKLGEDFSYAAARGLIGTDFDSLTGQWAAQGPNLYMLGRLHDDPRMSVEAVLDEYYSAFGKAANAVRDYFAHWEQVSDAVTDELAKEADLHYARFYCGADRVFTPAVMATGRDLLEKAEAAARDDSAAAARVAFLGKGFKNAELTLAVQCVYRQYRQDGRIDGFAAAMQELDDYRAQIEGECVANMGFLRWAEKRTWDRKLVKRTGGAVEREPMLPATTPPIVYTFGYTDQYFTDPQYIDQFKAAPPDLLHIGKAVPITHVWGPVSLYAGENQYTGNPDNSLNIESLALLTPDALTQRVECIRNTLARYHAIGVREITPYLSQHTLAGDHEKRLGFWKFYDEWAQYEKWAGPRPQHDPFDWLAVDREGKFLAGSCGGFTPYYFTPLHRYLACINNPDWAEWQRRLVRMTAEVGYDGCFVDNSGPDVCYCRHCKERFHNWLAANRGLEWVRRLTEKLDINKLTLDSECVPAELVRRWRVLCAAEHLGMIRETGRKVRRGFTIFPNTGNIHECLTMGSQCDRLMFENGFPPGLQCANKLTTAEETKPDQCVNHMAELLFAQHMHARTIFLLDYRSLEKTEKDTMDWAVYYLHFPLENRWDNVQNLALAEMAAFSGGGGVTGSGRPQSTYRGFFKKYPDMFTGWQPTAQAAVLYAYWGPNPLSPRRGAGRHAIHDHLAASQRPYVALVDATLPKRAEDLARFVSIYLESPAYEMALEQIEALREYAGRGRVILADKGLAINGRLAIELLGKDRVTIWSPKDPLMPSAAIAPSEGIRQNVRFAVYEKADRLAIHVVNYNVCLLDPDKKVLEVDLTPLCLPLPAGWTAATATCFDPNSAPETVPCSVIDGVARMTLPKLHIYKIVLLERQGRAHK